MFWPLLVTFVFISSISIITASFHCVKCAQLLTLGSTQKIDADRVECVLKTETNTMCMATLQMDFGQNNASVLFDGFSPNSLNVSQTTKIITHRMQISLDTSNMKRTIEVYCARNKSCVDEISKIYERSDISRIRSLQTDLQLKLFNSSNSPDLVCENNQNETVPCPNGFCQLIDNGESNYIRNCISKDFFTFSPSILIASSLTNQFNKISSFMYFCNQPRCNSINMAKDIQNSLEKYHLLTSVYDDQPSQLITTTTTTSTTVKSKSIIVRMLPQTMIVIQCISIFMMTILI